MELVAATRTAEDRVAVTLGDGRGLIALEASVEEAVALCDALEQVAVLAGAAAGFSWVATLPAGRDVVRLGIARGRVRLVVEPGPGDPR